MRDPGQPRHHATTTSATRARSSRCCALTPRPHEGQQVIDWRVDADADVRLRWTEDAFGNIVHSLSIERPVSALTITVSRRGRHRPTPPAWSAGRSSACREEVYLRATAADPAGRRPWPTSPATSIRRARPGELERLHAPARARCTAQVAFDVGRDRRRHQRGGGLRPGTRGLPGPGHVFIAAARAWAFPPATSPATCCATTARSRQDASHAWAEALVPGLGWVGFDPANGVCPTDAYVRVAVGLDYLDAAPVRGTRNGGGAERMAVKLKVRDEARNRSPVADGRHSPSRTVSVLRRRQGEVR